MVISSHRKCSAAKKEKKNLPSFSQNDDYDNELYFFCIDSEKLS